MRPCYFLSLALALLGFTATAQDISRDDLTPLSGPDIIREFADRMMKGVYKRPRARSGTQFFTEWFSTDGTTLYREGEVMDTGQWRAKDNTLCFSYDGPLAGDESCFSVFRVGTCYYSYAPQSVIGGKPISPNAWSVKSKLDGDLSSCEDLAV